jgi:hypothetical protein
MRAIGRIGTNHCGSMDMSSSYKYVNRASSSFGNSALNNTKTVKMALPEVGTRVLPSAVRKAGKYVAGRRSVFSGAMSRAELTIGLEKINVIAADEILRQTNNRIAKGNFTMMVGAMLCFQRISRKSVSKKSVRTGRISEFWAIFCKQLITCYITGKLGNLDLIGKFALKT